MTALTFTAALLEPTKYKEGIQAGFIVFPHSKDVPAGWGEPYFATDGTPIYPGTENGANPNRAVGYTVDGWGLKRSKYWQVAGAIDWWGDWKDPIKKAKRNVLSWNGPLSRYWNVDGKFQYDGNVKNQEVYKDGKVIAVAPLPVLGAALTVWNKPVGTGVTTPTTLILIVCKSGANDQLYYQEVGAPVVYGQLTDAVRFNMSQLRSDNYPNGWVAAGLFTGPNGVQPPEVPWFFSMDGTKARTMHRVSKQFTNEEAETKTQNSYIEVILSFSTASLMGAFDYSDEDAKFTYSEHCTKTRPTWTDPIADQYGIYHTWQEDWLVASTSQLGRVKVAVDWSIVDNNWAYAWLDVNDARRMEQYWTTGTDAPAAPHSNNGLHTGTRYPPSSTPLPGDHTETQWVGAKEIRKLLMGTDANSPALSFIVGYGFTGTKTLATTGTENFTADPYLYFWDSLDIFSHHIDLRSYLIAGFIRYDSMTIPQDGTGVGFDMDLYYEEIEWADVKPTLLYDEAGFFSRFTSPITIESSSFFYWDRITMQGWPATFDSTFLVTDYQGEKSTANDAGAIFNPVLATFFHSPTMAALPNPLFSRYTVDNYIGHLTNCWRDGQYSSAENSTQLVSYTYHDTATNEDKEAVRLYPDGDLATICYGGEKFQGGGTL